MASGSGRFAHNLLPRSRKESEELGFQTERVKSSMLMESPVKFNEDNSQSMQMLHDHLNRHFEKIKADDATRRMPDLEVVENLKMVERVACEEKVKEEEPKKPADLKPLLCPKCMGTKVNKKGTKPCRVCDGDG